MSTDLYVDAGYTKNRWAYGAVLTIDGKISFILGKGFDENLKSSTEAEYRAMHDALDFFKTRCIIDHYYCDNQAACKQFQKYLGTFRSTVIWLKGHACNLYNIRADSVASAALSKRDLPKHLTSYDYFYII